MGLFESSGSWDQQSSSALKDLLEASASQKAVAEAVVGGRMFFGGASHTSGTGAGSSGAMVLYNPPASGKDLIVVGFAYTFDANTDATLINDAVPTGSETAITAHPWNQYYEGAVTSAGQLSKGPASAYSGGNDTLPLRAAANITIAWQNLNIIVPPGQSFGLKIYGSGLAAAVQLYGSAFWYESDVAA